MVFVWSLAVLIGVVLMVLGPVLLVTKQMVFARRNSAGSDRSLDDLPGFAREKQSDVAWWLRVYDRAEPHARHLVACIGIASKQNGHSFVVGVAAGFKNCRPIRNTTKATMTKSRVVPMNTP